MNMQHDCHPLSPKWVACAWRSIRTKRGSKDRVTIHEMQYRLDFGLSAIVQEVPADADNYPKDPRTKWTFHIPKVDTSTLEKVFDTPREAMEAGSAILAELVDSLAKELRNP